MLGKSKCGQILPYSGFKAKRKRCNLGLGLHLLTVLWSLGLRLVLHRILHRALRLGLF